MVTAVRLEVENRIPVFVRDKVVKNQVPGVAVFQPGGARRVDNITILKIDYVIGIGGENLFQR